MSAPFLALDLRRRYDNRSAMTLHCLSGTDLGGLAGLRLAVDRYSTLRDQVLAARATVGEPGQLEQIAQPDKFAFELNLDGFHDSPDDWRSTLAYRRRNAKRARDPGW